MDRRIIGFAIGLAMIFVVWVNSIYNMLVPDEKVPTGVEICSVCTKSADPSESWRCNCEKEYREISTPDVIPKGIGVVVGFTGIVLNLALIFSYTRD